MCTGGQTNNEMEVPIMSSEFCNECRKKKGQGEKEPQKPQKEGSTNEGSSGPPKDGSNNGSQGNTKDCKVCWGGDMNHEFESDIMSSQFCHQCIENRNKGTHDGSETGNQKKPQDNAHLTSQNQPRIGFDYVDWTKFGRPFRLRG